MGSPLKGSALTVIAYDGTTLAADRLCSFDDGTFCEVTKIFRREADGVIYGVAGQGPQLQAVQDWFENGGNPNSYPESVKDHDHIELLYIGLDGRIKLLLNSPYPTVIESNRFSIGCASEAALVLMDVGLSAELAVLKVSEFNVFCGCGVNTLRAGA